MRFRLWFQYPQMDRRCCNLDQFLTEPCHCQFQYPQMDRRCCNKIGKRAKAINVGWFQYPQMDRRCCNLRLQLKRLFDVLFQYPQMDRRCCNKNDNCSVKLASESFSIPRWIEGVVTLHQTINNLYSYNVSVSPDGSKVL